MDKTCMKGTRRFEITLNGPTSFMHNISKMTNHILTTFEQMMHLTAAFCIIETGLIDPSGGPTIRGQTKVAYGPWVSLFLKDMFTVAVTFF